MSFRHFRVSKLGLIIFVILNLVASFGYAETPIHLQQSESPTNPPKPTLNKEAGKPLTATFPDGRIATLFSSQKEPVNIITQMDSTEVSCSKTQTTSIQYHFEIFNQALSWRWSSHPDPKKIGEILESKNSFSSDASWEKMETSPVTWSRIDSKSSPKAAENLRPDQLELDDELLKSLKVSPWSPWTIGEWAAEAMLPNPETGIEENRVFAGALDLNLTPLQKNIFEISSVGSYFFTITTDSIIGEVIHWTIATSSARHCHLVFKPNIGQLRKQFDDYSARPFPAATPYLWGQDEFFQTKKVFTFAIDFELFQMVKDIR
ncbi:MAG: hypothetical protein KDD61_14280 [Bdellovibrionales bacterium]|nr:hypothetical protein [Bdellovibrionales bacterium]